MTETLNTLHNKDTSHDNLISSINSAILTLQSADIIHDGLIDDINIDINNLETLVNSKQNIINTNNLLSSSLIETDVDETLDDRIILIENLINTKQNQINTNNKLPISNVDLGSSSLSYVDISSNLQAQLTNINNAISTLEGLQQGDTTSFQTIQDNFDTLETLVNSKQNILDTNNKLLSSNVDYSNSSLRFVDISSNLQTQLDNLANQSGGSSIPSISHSGTTTTISDITSVETLKFIDNSEQTTAFTNSINTQIGTNTTDINSLDTRLTTAENNIQTNTNDINTKNDIIDANNKLSIDFIDLGTNQLIYVDSGITQNISTSLSSLNSSISGLQTSDEGQTTAINNITTSINDLTNNKQNLINGSNLLSSEYISYNASNVKTELDNINTSISGKAEISSLSTYAPLNNPTFTGTISGITKTMVGLSNVDNTSDINKPISTLTTNALNLKANINNQEFTGYIQTPRIFENISVSFVFGSNILTYNYANGSILFFNGLTSATNFRLDLQNINPNNETNRSFTFFNFGLVI